MNFPKSPVHEPAGPVRKGDWTQCRSGRRFWPLDPRPEDIDIHDIAHALAIVPRFGGHTKFPWSVGIHSILVSGACDPKDALWGLLHDASEAYLLDVQRPLKRLPEWSFYREVEDKVQRVVCDRFGLPHEMPASVHQADGDVLLAEAKALMGDEQGRLGPEWDKWLVNHKPAAVPIYEVGWRVVRDLFLDRFRELTGERVR